MSGTELPETTRLRKRIELLEASMLEAAKRHDALCDAVASIEQRLARPVEVVQPVKRGPGRPRKVPS